jgi:two-component system OmpR family response regulator
MEVPRSAGRILVVEDDDFMRESVTLALRTKGFEVAERHDGVGIEETIDVFHPDMIVLDIGLPDGRDGVSIAKRIRHASEVSILFISGSHRLEDRLAGFAVGGDDFLTKPFSMAELVARVQAILRRGRLIARYDEVGGIVIDEEGHRATRNGTELKLTPIEFSLLATLCRSPGRVFSKVQLLRLVWGFDHFDVNLVEVHVSALRSKLEAHGPRVVQTVRGVGYALRDESFA